MILCVRVNGADGGVAGVQQNLPLGGLLPDGRDSACSGLEAARSQGRELARRLPLLLAHPHPHRLPMVGEGEGGERRSGQWEPSLYDQALPMTWIHYFKLRKYIVVI